MPQTVSAARYGIVGSRVLRECYNGCYLIERGSLAQIALGYGGNGRIKMQSDYCVYHFLNASRIFQRVAGLVKWL